MNQRKVKPNIRWNQMDVESKNEVKCIDNGILRAKIEKVIPLEFNLENYIKRDQLKNDSSE